MTAAHGQTCTRKRQVLRHPDYPITFDLPTCEKCNTVFVDTGSLSAAEFAALPDGLVVGLAQKMLLTQLGFEVTGEDPGVVRAFKAMFSGGGE